MFETFCGGQPNPPREHPSEQAAHGYAAEATGRKVCDVAVFGEDGTPVAMYRDGVKA